MSSFTEDGGELIVPLVDEADLILPSDGVPIEIDADGDDVRRSLAHTMLDLRALTSLSALPVLTRENTISSSRPILRRDGSIPAPRQPPPNPPPAAPELPPGNNAQDSLSLQRLRSLRDFPRLDLAPYAFVYADAASLPEEIEEWFSYSIEERARISRTHSSFGHEWSKFNNLSFAEGSGTGTTVHDWMLASEEKRKDFINAQLDGLEEKEIEGRLYHLEALLYLALGCWHETSGLPSENWRQFGDVSRGPVDSAAPSSSGHSENDTHVNNMIESRYEDFGMQIEWIRRNVLMILETKGPLPLLDVFKSSIEREW
jgi:hypothetical protein